MEERARSRVIGQPVLSISEGIMLGRVRRLIISGTEKSVIALLIERFRGGREERILPFSAVRSFGEDGVTVERHQLLERRGADANYVRALRHPLPLIGSRVFSDSGCSIGKIEEFRFAANSGRISTLAVNGGLRKGTLLIEGSGIVAISAQTVMIRQSAADAAILAEGTLLTNVSDSLDAVRERAARLRDNAVEATRSFTANIGEAIGLPTRHGASDDFDDDTDTKTEREQNAAPPPAWKDGILRINGEEISDTAPAP